MVKQKPVTKQYPNTHQIHTRHYRFISCYIGIINRLPLDSSLKDSAHTCCITRNGGYFFNCSVCPYDIDIHKEKYVRYMLQPTYVNKASAQF